MFFCSQNEEDILEIEAEFSDIDPQDSQLQGSSVINMPSDNIRKNTESNQPPIFTVNLPHNYASNTNFSDEFYNQMTHKTWVPDDEGTEPPHKRYVYVSSLSQYSECPSESSNPKNCREEGSTCTIGLSQESRFLTKTSNDQVVIPHNSQNMTAGDLATASSINKENVKPQSKQPKRKRKRISRKQALETSLITPPWFLDPSKACFTCKRYMGNYQQFHKSHKPKDPLFSSAPFLTKENAEKWAILFDKLITQIKVYFYATSAAHLLQILHEKMPQNERLPVWDESTKYVLSIFHDKFYDAVNVDDVKFSPPNSLKVLADDYYFRKLIDILSPDFRRTICALE